MKEKFTQNKQLAYCGLLLFFLLFSNKGFSIDYTMRLNNGNWVATTATTYYKNANGIGVCLTGGTAMAIGTTPTASDNVYIVTGLSSGVTTFNIGASAACNNLYVVSQTGTQNTAATLNIRLGGAATTGTFNLTINGNLTVETYLTATSGTVPFDRIVNIYKNTTAISSTVTVGGNVTIGTTSYIAGGINSLRKNTLNIGTYNVAGTTNLYNAPDVSIAGNINIYNQIDDAGGTSRMNSSQLRLNNGTMTLTGDGTTGYINTTQGGITALQTGNGLNTDNKFNITDNSATLVLKHKSDTPFTFTTVNYANTVPLFDFGTVRYDATTPSTSSVVLNVNHHNLIINNNATIATNGASNLKIGNELTIESGTFTVPGLVDIYSDQGTSSKISIKGGKIVSTNSAYLNFQAPTTIEYSLNAVDSGIELPNAVSAGKLDVLNLLNTSGGTFTFNANATANTINLRKNNFTLSDVTLTGNTLISLEGANAIYNCNLVTKLLNIKNSCTFAKNQTIYSENSSNNTTDGAINIGGGTGITDYIIKLTDNAVVKTSDLTISGNTILDNTSVGKFNVYRYVAMPNNTSRNLTSNGILVLKSNSFQTARVDSYLSVNKGRILGDVTVERYLQNSNRRWRLLTAPVVSATNNSIWYNWQNNGNIINSGTISGVPINGYGTDVWGPDPSYTINDNGMYYLNPPTGTQTAPSSTHNFRKWGYFYDNTAQSEIWKFASVTNTLTEPMNDGTINNAFLAFVVKPFGFGVTLTNGVANEVLGATATTLAATGNLIYDTQNYTMTADTFSLIANPYASTINFDDLLSLNDDVSGNGAIYSKLWFLDPNIGRGGYVNYDPLVGWSNTNARHASNSGMIQSGEGFFVMGGPGGGPLEINESMKTLGSAGFVFGKTTNSAINVEKLRVNLEKEIDGAPTNIDACVVGFYDGGSNAVNIKDVQKLTNPEETISFVNGTTKLSSEHRAPITSGDTLFISLTKATANTNYTLKINTENFSFNGTATFYDLKLGTQTTIALDGSVFEYPFAVTTDATTQGTRFKITFTAALGVNTFANNEGISAYPNPVSKSETLNINMGTLAKGNYAYRVVNMIGQEVQTGTIENNTSNQEPSITFSKAINSGLYVVELTDDSKSVHTLRIIIK